MKLVCLLTAGLLLVGCTKEITPAPYTQPKQPDTAVTAAPSLRQPQASGDLKIFPSEVKLGQKAIVALTLKNRSGLPVKDAKVTVSIVMAMGKMEMRDEAEMKPKNDSYIGTVEPKMIGEWNVTVEAKDSSGKLLLSFQRP